MKEKTYKDFSRDTHVANGKQHKPNVCQFELTFRCGLHCAYCYSDCFNNDRDGERELDTATVKRLLDDIHAVGVLWLCFTGGDPLVRKDFPELYLYAKRKGFIITVYTNGMSMTPALADLFRMCPPFAIEITLNAVRGELYEKITGVPGSFDRVMQGVDLIMERELPLKIKTQIIRDNLRELDTVREFVTTRGSTFNPSPFIFPRLNGDRYPCSLRITPDQVLLLYKEVFADWSCGEAVKKNRENTDEQDFSSYVFSHCAVGYGDSFRFDPYGNMFLCRFLRHQSISYISGEYDLKEALQRLNSYFRTTQYVKPSACFDCDLRALCYNCPGNAFLETGDKEAPVSYFCKVAKKVDQTFG